MDRPDRNEKDDAQKAKLIFMSIAALVVVLLIWSFVSASNARKERDAAQQKLVTLEQDNTKLEQMLKDQNVVVDDLKRRVQQCEAKVKTKPGKKGASSKSKTSKSKRTR